MNLQEEVNSLFTHKEKGGTYKLLSISKGTGKHNGLSFITYQRTYDKEFFVREYDDFLEKMERISIR